MGDQDTSWRPVQHSHDDAAIERARESSRVGEECQQRVTRFNRQLNDHIRLGNTELRQRFFRVVDHHAERTGSGITGFRAAMPVNS